MTQYIHINAVQLIAKLFSPVKLPEELLKLKPELNHTILITQSSSWVIEGLLSSFARRLGFDGAKRLQRKDLADLLNNPIQEFQGLNWASMHDFSELAWREGLEDSSTKLQARTFNVFQVKGPIRKWPSFKPSIFWIWGLIPTRRILTVTIGEAVSFAQQSSGRFLRLIKIDFVRTLKLVRGTPFVPREEQAREILAGPEFEREIRIISERTGVSVAQGRRLAEKAFYELAASPRRFMYDTLSIVAKLITSRLFSEVHTRGLDKLIPAIKENTVILVPMHRSHLDYVLVGYKLFSEKVNPPLVAAGVNLAFWPFGFIFRSVGAYFVKRNARDRFHTIVLKRYVSYLVTHGHLQEFFIEGGRSRSGKMLPPKLGLLSTIVDTWKPEKSRDILFVPVSITYENLVEDEAFGSENSGGKKVKESIGSTLKAFDVFRKRYGEVIIDFGQAISHRAFRQKMLDQEGARFSQRAVTQELAYELCRAIRDQANPGLTSLCYTALLMSHHYGLNKSRLISTVRNLHEYLEILRNNDIQVGTNTPQLSRFINNNADVISELAHAGVVKLERHFNVDYYYIPGNKRFTADYYRNSIVHYFFNLALISLCSLVFGKIDLNNLQKLFPFFEYDLLLQDCNKYSKKLEETLSLLEKAGILNRDSDSYLFKKDAERFFIPALLYSNLQSYKWISESLLSTISSEDNEPEMPQYEKFISKLLASSKTFTYNGNITRTEGAARSAITAILSSLEARDFIKFGEGSSSERAILINPEKLDALKAEILFLSQINLAIEKWLVECGG